MNSEIKIVREIQSVHKSQDRLTLDEIQRGWLQNPETELSRKKDKPIDLGCIIYNQKPLGGQWD